MISFTVDSAQYHGSSSPARTAAGLERVFFAEPFVRVKAITRQVVASDGQAEHAGASGKVCVGSDRIYYAEPFVFVRKIERKFFIKEVSSESIAPSKGTCVGVDKLYRQPQVFGGVGVATSGGLSSLDTAAYQAALASVKTVRAGFSDTPTNAQTTAFKDAIIAMDAARDSALAVLKSDLGFVGSATHTGSVMSGVTAYPRQVRIYERHSGELVDTVYPDAAGAFSFSGVAAGEYYLVTLDFGTTSTGKNPIIKNIVVT